LIQFDANIFYKYLEIIMVTVMVIHQASGKPYEGERVSIGIDDGLFGAGGVTGDELSDKRGEAHFPDVDPCNGRIFVSGSTVYKGRIEGRTVVYI
jgi:hypothetical protein